MMTDSIDEPLQWLLSLVISCSVNVKNVLASRKKFQEKRERQAYFTNTSLIEPDMW